MTTEAEVGVMTFKGGRRDHEPKNESSLKVKEKTRNRFSLRE